MTLAPWPSPKLRGRVQFPRTTDLPLRPPAPPTWPSPLACEFRVCPLLRPACVAESHTTRGCVPTRRTITMQRRHQSGVHCELGSVPQGGTINDDLNAALIEAIERTEVQISNKSVTPHAPTCLPACLCGSSLEREPPGSQHPSPRTRCTMVAIHVKEAATLAGARGQWERKEEASTQPLAEWLWIQSGRATGWQGCECCRCQRAALRPHQCTDRVCESGPQLHPEVLVLQASCGAMLPPHLGLSGFRAILPLRRCISQCPPRWNLQPCFLQRA